MRGSFSEMDGINIRTTISTALSILLLAPALGPGSGAAYAARGGGGYAARGGGSAPAYRAPAAPAYRAPAPTPPRVSAPPSGGGFGGHMSMNEGGFAALAAPRQNVSAPVARSCGPRALTSRRVSRNRLRRCHRPPLSVPTQVTCRLLTGSRTSAICRRSTRVRTSAICPRSTGAKTSAICRRSTGAKLPRLHTRTQLPCRHATGSSPALPIHRRVPRSCLLPPGDSVHSATCIGYPTTD